VKHTGKPSAGNLHAGFDEAGAGNRRTIRLVRHSQRKRGATDRLNLRRLAPVLDPTDDRRRLRDPDTSDELRKDDQEQFDKMLQQLKGEDIKRVDDFIANFKPLPYWFCPQFLSPGRIFKDQIPRLFDMYRQFSGSTHGSFIGSVLFSDSPDGPSIDPQENPARTRNAIVASSRLLLDISFARGQLDGIADLAEYKEIVKAHILPQKGK
jgi:hypothetical protein